MTQWCVERCLPFVPLPDANQMVGVLEIQLSEDGGLVQSREAEEGTCS